jgi:hypothetical protein
MKDQYLKYLSETNDEKLIPLMEKYFNDEINIEDLGYEVMELGHFSYKMFVKEQNINSLLNDSE